MSAKTCATCSAPLPDDAPAGALCSDCSMAAAATTVIQKTRMAPALGTIGDYEVLDKLGEGGMGAVYRARQSSLERIVALKVLPDQAGQDDDSVSRFEREARVAAQLNHPNLVRVYASGSAEGVHFIAMELVEGENLHQRLKRGALPMPEAVRTCADVARALQCGWDTAQLIHRDIKPSNIYLSHDGAVKLGDLGIAKSLLTNTTGLTQTGTMMGTPHYISPEQARADKNLDFRADIYSLGCTLFQCLTGRTPYEADDAFTLTNLHVNGPPPALLKVLPGTPLPLARLVGKMLKKSRHERHGSYADLIADMERVMDVLVHGDASAGRVAQAWKQSREDTVLPVPKATVARPATTLTAPGAKSKMPLYGAIAAGVIVLGAVAYLTMKPKESAPRGTSSAAQPEPPVTARTPAGGPNLLPNPSFEQTGSNGLPADWQVSQWAGSAEWSSDAKVARSGRFAAHAVAAADGADSSLLCKVSVRPGATYRLSAWVRTRGVSGAMGAFANRNLTNAAQGWDVAFTAPFRTPPVKGDTDWALVEKTFSVDVAEIEICCALGGWGKSVGEAWFDDGSLVEVQPPPPGYAPPATLADLPELRYGGHRYFIDAKGGNFNAMKARAEAMGGHLAVITDNAEWEAIAEWIGGHPKGTRIVIGASSPGGGQPWTWITGEPFEFAAWPDLTGPEAREGPAIIAIGFPHESAFWLAAPAGWSHPYALVEVEEAGEPSAGSTGKWQPLLKDFSEARGENQVENGLLRLANMVLRPMPEADGAIRAQFDMREESQGCSVVARSSGKTGSYKLILQPAGRTVALLYYPPDLAPVLLGNHHLEHAVKAGDMLTLELRLQGDRLIGVVNGREVIEARDTRIKYKGHWGVMGKPAWVKSIEVRGLEGPTTTDGWTDVLAAWWASNERNDSFVKLSQGWTKAKGDGLIAHPDRIVRGDQSARVVFRLRESPYIQIFLRRTLGENGGPATHYKASLEPASNLLRISYNGPDVTGDDVIGDVGLPEGFESAGRHSLQFGAEGDTLTAILDGKTVFTGKDSRLAKGYTVLNARAGAIIERFEVREEASSGASGVEGTK